MSFDSARYRHVLGHFPTGVTVITACVDGQPAGLTIGSFTSVSLDPPLVLFCVARTSTTWPRIEKARKFAVNILGEHQEDVSRVFAKKGPPEKGTLRGQPFRVGRTGAPILEDCLAYIDCAVRDTLEGGDHSIFLGEVMDEAVLSEVKPLLFFRGGYHSID